MPKAQRDTDKFPTWQLFLLALIRVSEPIALTSIFPYAWQFVIDLDFCDRTNASFWAGILIAAFSLAEALTGVYWGGLSDRIGRKPVLLFGCFGTMLSLVIVGFSSSFWVALAGRALGGLLNGNIGVIQTMVSELVTKKEHEPRAFAIMPFVWSIGSIAGPVVGGFFAYPAKNFPSIFAANGVFARFPYLLPNLICAGLMLSSIIAGYFFLDETHPDMQPWSTPSDLASTTVETPLIPAQAGTTTAAANLAQENSYGTFSRIERDQEEDWGKVKSKAKKSDKKRVYTRRVQILVASLGVFCFHSMAYDHLLPIFLQDERAGDASVASLNSLAGGLGLDIQDVGLIMSVNGIIAMFVQALVFPLAASWLGVWRTFVVVTVLHPVALFIVPYLTILPADMVYPGIYACLTLRNILSILAYPVTLILIKEAAPSPSCLGKINGLAASTGAACRCLASPIAGFLYGVGIEMNFTAIAWWASACVALIGTIQALLIRRKKSYEMHHVAAPGPCRFNPVAPPREVIHVHVTDVWRREETDERQRLLEDA